MTMLSFIEPMKALSVEHALKGDWLYEIKFDGFRALAFKDGNAVRLLSRTNKDFGNKFPEIVGAVRSLRIKRAIIDGEIVALNDNGVSSFQLLQTFEMGDERPPLCYFAFDLLDQDGADLRSLTLVDRKHRLEQVLRGGPKLIRCSPSVGTDAARLLKQAAKLGLEGLIGKRPDSVYEPGRRSGAWIKLKLQWQQEFVIGGYTEPEGTRAHLGALLLGVHAQKKLVYCGKVGAGFDDASLRQLHGALQKIARQTCPFVDLPEQRPGRYGQGITPTAMKSCHWVKPVLVCQAKFFEWTLDNRLRQPVYLGLREDKNAKEVVREPVTS